MKLLFISIRDVGLTDSGGSKCTNRNYLSFCKILGAENVKVINVSTPNERSFARSFFKRFSFFFGCYAGLTLKLIRTIKKVSPGYDFVFIDASYLGKIASSLKQAGYKGKIISHFHNIEVDIMRQKSRIQPLNFWKIFLVKYNENKAVRFSDRLIVLNKREKNELIRQYLAKKVEIIPISLPDELIHTPDGFTKVPPTLLFIGDNWYPNIHGLRWFIDNVLPEVNVKLQIVGRNMEGYGKEFSNPKIQFLGYVKDLSALILDADYILCPIFQGGGMKVKICEALMYGKNIIATAEAFEGYDVDYGKTGAVCNTKDEFIKAITALSSIERPKFNMANREIFLEKYSFEATLGRFRELLD
jgi:polysaccharide biosynthesis protein PslH